MNIARKVSLIALISAVICGPVSADFVGLNIGVSHWTPDIKGSFSSGSASSIQLDSDLGYSDHSSTTLNASFEHPIPLLPNIKYSGSDLNASSNSTLTQSLNFEGQSYLANANISSTLDLSHNDIVLYYEILDNWVNIDVGVDLKKFDGKVSIRDNADVTSSRSITVDETIPMLYLAARFDLPLTGFYVGANIQQLSIGDNSAEDTTVMIGYESKMGLGVEGGYKTFTLELDGANNLNTNLEYDGLFLNGYFHF
jgi:outer membrane protein